MQKDETLKYDFSDFDIIITDSEDLLNFAYNYKLPKKTKIFSTSPKINYNHSLSLINLKKKYSVSKNIKLKKIIKRLMDNIALFLEKDSEKKILKGIAMREICSLIPMYERCLLFDSLDLRKKILIIEHELYKTSYSDLFSNLSNVQIIILKNTEVRIKNFVLSKAKSKYLHKENLTNHVANYFESLKQQWLVSKWIKTGMWRSINLTKPPFNFPKVIELYPESNSRTKDKSAKFLGLCELNNIYLNK